jgi:thioesterase domain-containing protein
MLTDITSTYGIELNPSDLASSPTVAQFAERLVGAGDHPSQTGGLKLSPTTVPLRAMSSATSGAPLMCFPGAGAASLTFAPLAAQVGSATAVYAFAPKGLERREIPDLSVRRAARRHLTDLRRIQPHGPYILVGHCLGAHIALEVARKLENDGAQVDLVVMLDPWLSQRAADAVRGDLTDATITLAGAAPTDLRSWWEHQKKLPLAGLFVGGNERRAAAVEEVGMATGMRHVPAPWTGRALVIMSHLNRDDPRLWRRILTGDVTMRRMDCDHNSIVREPHVNDVLEMINEMAAAVP